MFQIQQGAGRFPRCLSIGAGAPATGAPFQWVGRGANALTLNPVATPDGQGVTWVELFFDLIFVFSVTQLVGLLHDGFTWLAVGQVALAFWFVWFAWSQFTWALNAANTHHNTVQRFTLGAAAVVTAGFARGRLSTDVGDAVSCGSASAPRVFRPRPTKNPRPRTSPSNSGYRNSFSGLSGIASILTAG